MRLAYYPETDSLYTELKNDPSVDSQEVKPGVVLDFDASGDLVRLDIQHASAAVDLSRLEIEALPVTSVGLVA